MIKFFLFSLRTNKEGYGVRPHLALNFALDAVYWLASRPGHLTPGEIAGGTLQIEGVLPPSLVWTFQGKNNLYVLWAVHRDTHTWERSTRYTHFL